MNELRKLFFEGKIQEGNQIAGEFLHGNGHSFGTHLPIGDLKLTFSYPERDIIIMAREKLMVLIFMAQI